MKRCNHFGCEPVWRVREQLLANSPVALVSDWLFDRGSLTRRLIDYCNGCFRVRVVNQGWQMPFNNEQQRLGIKRSQLAWIREVFLYCNDKPVVFARSVIPRTSLVGSNRHLVTLGTRPLGAVLFADPGIKREPIEVARLLKGDGLFQKSSSELSIEPNEIWGRRSVFYLNQKPLLVNEIFLPSLFTDMQDSL